MAKSQQSFGKQENEKKRLKKREEKKQKREERIANSQGGKSGDMIAYVDEYGNIVDSPPDPSKKEKIDADSIELGVPKREKQEFINEFKGRVDFFNDSKGFGFIKELNSDERYFVHISGIIDDVSEGDVVSFKLERGQKGMNAVEVRKA